MIFETMTLSIKVEIMVNKVLIAKYHVFDLVDSGLKVHPEKKMKFILKTCLQLKGFYLLNESGTVPEFFFIYVLQINTVLNRYIILLPHIPMLIRSYEEVDPKLS
jgi:hypothetical protein